MFPKPQGLEEIQHSCTFCEMELANIWYIIRYGKKVRITRTSTMREITTSKPLFEEEKKKKRLIYVPKIWQALNILNQLFQI